MIQAAGSIGLTRSARLYALKELARRAGVTPEFMRSWRIDVREAETTVHVEPGTGKQIRFAHAPPAFWRDLAAGRFQTTRACWMSRPAESVRKLVPDFVVPFCHETAARGHPLFSPVEHDRVYCFLDLLASALLSLSRYEEGLSTERDAHGRFPASQSLAVREGYLKRPVVDEYGLAMEQALTYLLPPWKPVKRKLRVKLSHDVDWTGLPVGGTAALFSLAHMLHHWTPLAIGRELLRRAAHREPTYMRLVREIVQLSLDRGLDSAVYWMAARPSRTDSGYNLRHPRIQEVIAWLNDHGVEMGVHPGYHTFLCLAKLQREVQAVREALGPWPLGGRQHYLRWCPETWLHWERCGLAYDSSVGYADQIGFRAGTCIPFRPWLLALDREAELIEIPLLVMDVTLLEYMGLLPEQCLDAVRELVARCRLVGGVFTLLWHNTWLFKPGDRELYRKLLDVFAGHDRYDWRTRAAGF